MALVAAFTGIDRLRDLYDEAVQEGYRFHSYGDAMLLLPGDHSLGATESFLAAAADNSIAFESGEPFGPVGPVPRVAGEANETTNLTRIVDPDDAWPRHILDLYATAGVV